MIIVKSVQAQHLVHRQHISLMAVVVHPVTALYQYCILVSQWGVPYLNILILCHICKILQCLFLIILPCRFGAIVVLVQYVSVINLPVYVCSRGCLHAGFLIKFYVARCSAEWLIHKTVYQFHILTQACAMPYGLCLHRHSVRVIGP